jgi:cell division septum initiation protein DivIVA
MPPEPGVVDFLPVLTAIEQLEDTILNSPRVPLTGKTIVNEEELLEQLDAIRTNLPEIVDRAQEILAYKDLLIREAHQQSQQILSEATQRANQIANELGIIDRAEQEATRIRQITLSECEQLRQQTAIEMERVRHHNINEIERVRHQVMVECEQVQDGADAYADRILHDLEHQLSTTLQSIQQGRQRLNHETAKQD